MAAVVDRLFASGALLLAGRGGLFFRFAAAGGAFVLIAWGLRRAPAAGRAWGQVVASLALIAVLTTPTIALLMAGYAVALFWLVEWSPAGRWRGVLVVALLALQVVGPIAWMPQLPGYAGKVRELVTFATNVALLRAWGFAYDRLQRPDPEPPTLRDFALFTFFFPAFLNGPLVSFEDFRRRHRLADAAALAPADVGRAAVRVAAGLVAAGMALALAPILEPASFDAAAHGGVLRAWAQAAGVYLSVYFGFTAWTETAIGLAAACGFALPENFNAPHFAYGVSDFWRRWNITLGHWLRSYVYLPLGGALPRGRSGVRRPEWRNTAAVFGVMVAYHLLGGMKLLGPGLFGPAVCLPWALWGTLNSIGVLATRQLARPAPDPARRMLVIVPTFAFAATGLLIAFFPAGLPLGTLARILGRMVGFG